MNTYIRGDSGGEFSILVGDSMGSVRKKSSYEHMSNSEWLQRWFESTDAKAL